MQAHCNVNSSERFAGESFTVRLRFDVGNAGRDLPARLRDSVATDGSRIVDDAPSVETVHEVVFDIPDTVVCVAKVAAQSVLCRNSDRGDTTRVRHRISIEKRDHKIENRTPRISIEKKGSQDRESYPELAVI